MNWLAAKKYILDAMTEASTWRGLVVLLTIGGTMVIAPEKIEAATTVAVVAAGLMKVLISDKL